MSGKIAQQVKVPATTSGERIHSLIVIVCVFGVHTHHAMAHNGRSEADFSMSGLSSCRY